MAKKKASSLGQIRKLKAELKEVEQLQKESIDAYERENGWKYFWIFMFFVVTMVSILFSYGFYEDLQDVGEKYCVIYGHDEFVEVTWNGVVCSGGEVLVDSWDYVVKVEERSIGHPYDYGGWMWNIDWDGFEEYLNKTRRGIDEYADTELYKSYKGGRIE